MIMPSRPHRPGKRVARLTLVLSFIALVGWLALPERERRGFAPSVRAAGTTFTVTTAADNGSNASAFTLER